MKTAIIAICAGLLIGGVIAFAGKGGDAKATGADNVSVADGKQIVKINAKGGYSPRITSAKANMPTILKIDTKGTFDCSSALAIPSLNYYANLPAFGQKEVAVPPQKPGTKLQGLCAMGMYNFVVNFN